MTLQKLQAKLDLEFNELVDEGLKWSIEHDENESVYFIDHAYAFAHYNEVKAFFDNMEEEDYVNDWQGLIEMKENEDILKGVYGDWLDYCHPERYNFFCYEDLTSIIRNYLRRKD